MFHKVIAGCNTFEFRNTQGYYNRFLTCTYSHNYYTIGRGYPQTTIEANYRGIVNCTI